MEFQLIQKGKLYSADCDKCSTTQYSHEWVHLDSNDRRDAMQAGTLACNECGYRVDAETFYEYPRPQYAARFSMPGYMDCTDWSYGPNKRALTREVKQLYT